MGKTSLVKRYVYGIFDDSYISTIGVNTYKKESIVQIDQEKYDVEMIIYDISGDLTNRQDLLKEDTKGANGIMLVYDVTRRETLNGLARQIASLSLNGLPFVLVGNKIDLIEEFEKINEVKIDDIFIDDELNERFNEWMHVNHKEVVKYFEDNYEYTPKFNPVSLKEGQLKDIVGESNELELFLTSAKKNSCVEEAFDSLARKTLEGV